MMDPASTVAEERNRVIAEAKFLRAWAYFDIVRLWGDAPMVLDLIPTITAENLDKWYPVMYPERSVADKIYDQILDDLNEENTIRYLVSKIKEFSRPPKAPLMLCVPRCWQPEERNQHATMPKWLKLATK